jgi:hypothetical protein
MRQLRATIEAVKSAASVIPGCTTWRRPGIHTADRGYGFRARRFASPRNDEGSISAASAGPSFPPAPAAKPVSRPPSAPAHRGARAQAPAWSGVRHRASTRRAGFAAAPAWGMIAVVASPAPSAADYVRRAGPAKSRISQVPPQSMQMRAAYPSCKRAFFRPKASRSPRNCSQYQRALKRIVPAGTVAATAPAGLRRHLPRRTPIACPWRSRPAPRPARGRSGAPGFRRRPSAAP